MFKRIVQRVNGLVMGQYIRASMLVKVRLLPSVKRLLASITQVFQSAVSLLCQAAQTALNIKAWLVNLITAGQLIKAALTSVKAKAILLGKQLLTTVRQISQAALTTLKQKKDKLVELIKSAPSRLRENKTVQTLMVRLLTQAGSKLHGLVSQLQQRAIQVFKKGQ